MAVRIVLKRSSIPNKRPNADILDPGELALNTNALTPGLFFETENNSVVKVGPTSVGSHPPIPTPSLGESFFNDVTKELKIGVKRPELDLSSWETVSAPYLGGSNGYVVFVAPEFPNSTDSVQNNGQSSPFRTLNRAVIEIAKQSILQQNESDKYINARFTIVVANGICPVYNGPGFPLPSPENPENTPEFSVNFEADSPSAPNVLNLQQFNPETGGLILPRGTSIVGIDLKKVQLRPSYVPTYKNPTTGFGTNQPRSAIIKWTGNSYVNEISFTDKREEIAIVDILSGPAGEGLFVSGRPHCFDYNDYVFFEFSQGADQTPISRNSTPLNSGYYYVYPVDVDTFYLSFTPLTTEPNYVERTQLPATPQGIGILGSCFWEGYSHNRLRALFCATKEELDTFYVKVQAAFPEFFQGKRNQAEVINPGETQIVAPTPVSVSESLAANSSANSSPYAENVCVRSSYGLCGVEHDGSLITGFRSAMVGQWTHVSLQNDPVAYEIYTTVQDPENKALRTDWYTLQYATWAGIPSAERPPSPAQVTRFQQLERLNATDLTNIRWYYQPLRSTDGKSFGIPNLNEDFRHFTIRAVNRAYLQVDSTWAIGCATGFWSYNGGRLTVTNSSANFGSMASRTEGFAGMGSEAFTSGAETPDKGFAFSGIRMPVRLTPADSYSSRRLELGPNFLSVTDTGEGVQEIVLGVGFQPINILPFSLSPGTAIYALSGAVEYRAFFVEDDRPPVTLLGNGHTILRVRSIDSSFPLGTSETFPPMKDWSSPFIKRWVDPRSLTESSYALILSNSNPDHRPPQIGNILRLDQANTGAPKLLRPGVQLDPGSSGGWGRIFQVAFTQSATSGDSPQFNETLLNRLSSTNHYVGLNLCDSGRPWVEFDDHPHGSYVTFSNRNWYATANDYWTSVYYSTQGTQSNLKKLNPGEYNSPWATTYCTERQDPVENTFQGSYAPDPEVSSYPEGSSYFRGDQPAAVNYDSEFTYNQDDGSPSFGLIDYTSPTPDETTTTDTLTPEGETVGVAQIKDIIPNPFLQFVVVSLTDGTGRIEYCQVLKADSDTLTLTLKRGLYGTSQEEDWPTDTVVTVQGPGGEIPYYRYDKDWAPSKSSLIRFLRVMGYTLTDILSLLRPALPSSRNLEVTSIGLSPKEGYALATGPWPLEFAYSSQIDINSQSFYSTGTITYSKGLPNYQVDNLPTKQYYDLLNARVWGGTGSIIGMDEDGSIPIAGVFTQAETGRPYGSTTSLITDVGRVDIAGDSGGGGGGGGVTAIYTTGAILGGPIFSEGTLSLGAPTATQIGGVRQGTGVLIENNGVISCAPPTSTTVGGVKQGIAIDITGDGTISAVPSGDANIPGCVKQGKGIQIDPDGTISTTAPPLPVIVRLDSIEDAFDGSRTTFPLTTGGLNYTPLNNQSVFITVGNVPQTAEQAYTVNNNTITFTEAPPAGANFYGLGFNGSIGNTEQIGVNIALIDDISFGFNGTATSFDLKVNNQPYIPVASYLVLVVIGGVVQSPPEAYSITGSRITFTQAPPRSSTFYAIAFG